jgi:hypothetical protein
MGNCWESVWEGRRLAAGDRKVSEVDAAAPHRPCCSPRGDCEEEGNRTVAPGECWEDS